MRLLTPDEQARVPSDKPIGTLEQQGLPPDSVGTGFVPGSLQDYVEKGSITDWRHAVALGIVACSRFAEWEPFRKQTGTEKKIMCQFGTAWASDGVHILIQGIDGVWFSRSAQVVTFRFQTPYSNKHKTISAEEYLRPKTKQPASLMSEYLSL